MDASLRDMPTCLPACRDALSTFPFPPQLHEEQEQLRGRLAQLQKTINSRQLADLDLFASKLQEHRLEFQEKLKEKDAQLTEAREELQAARETLRHQQLLNVLRNLTYTRHIVTQHSHNTHTKSCNTSSNTA
ncbi:hypothetical protein E2C01_029398 [Portunus trituberculatus]|uniref:Uncharacterized protein n=1 Tax=Portunus trituberculatus TaxID=210409 RepID=A0A5B7ES44_PORTR|nr:hypothetical protein [Portunus trituberculatus]